MYKNNCFHSHFVVFTNSCSSQYPFLFHLVPKQCLLSIEISQWNAFSATKWWWRRIWQDTSSLVIMGLYFVPNVHISVQKKKEDMNYHIAKHHAPKDTKLSTVCTVCLEEFPSFYSLQQHRRRKHGTSSKVGAKSSEKLKEVLESEELEKHNEQLQQELSACQHFLAILRWEMGDIKCSTASCPSSILMKFIKSWKKYSKNSTVLPKSTWL